MKAILQLKPLTAELIASTYHNIQAAQEYARSVAVDPDTPQSVKTELQAISASLTPLLQRIDRRIPKERWKEFSAQVKEPDCMILENVKSLYTRMTKEQKEMLEMCAEGIKNGEIILSR